ncbi:MAG: maleylpyruvate isomerase N-terminal domain-containing protein [Acidimicrobiia bacterium]
MSKPTVELHGVDAAIVMLSATVGGLSDADARGATRLAGWTRGHVLSHLARNADGQTRMVEGVLRAEVVEQYPGGSEQRAAEIEAGADRPIAVLLADLRDSQQALVDAWRHVPDGAWDRLTHARAGIRPVRAGVMSRWREILVHLVDLDVGVGTAQLPAGYVERDKAWLAEYRSRSTWPDAPW